jgi:hypothetical protein
MAGRLDVLTNLSGGPVALLNPINNYAKDLYVGLCEFTYTTGWVNISAALGNNQFSVRPSAAGSATTWTVPDGYYSVDTLKEAIQEKLPGFTATLNNATGRVRLTLSDANYQLNLLSTAGMWGFSAAAWLGPATTYTADAPPAFFPKRNLFVVLDQIYTADNNLNGRPGNLLRHIPITGESYGETRTISFNKVQFIRLRGDCFNELTLRVLDDTSTDISALCQPFSATLRIKNNKQ